MNINTIKNKIKITLAVIASAVVITYTVMQLSPNDEKAFQKLSKSEQELVIKLKKTNTPHEKLDENIKVLNEARDNIRAFNSIVERVDKRDLSAAKNLPQLDTQLEGLRRDIDILKGILVDLVKLKNKITIFDVQEIEETIKNVNEVLQKCQNDYKTLSNKSVSLF